MDSQPASPLPEDVDHVIFLIHGMGKPAAEAIHKNVDNLKKSAAQVLKEEFDNDRCNIKWIPIIWHHLLHQLDTVDERMKAITLPTCTLMRQTCNEILADVLFYFTSFHGQTLVNLITQEFNKQYQEFVVQHPNFKGKVAIVGHSLGGVISYDILANQGSEQVQIPEFPQSTTHFPLVYPKLDFVPDLFFVLGSPIAAVMVMRGQDVKQYRLPKEIRFFNIFSLYDPLAYRLEPLLNKRYTEISPVLLKRPSQAHTAFQFSYYKELIVAYMPQLNFSEQFQQFRMPTLSHSVLTSLNIPLPSLPNIPLLSQAEQTLRNQLNAFYESVPKIPNFLEDLPIPTFLEDLPIPMKRRHSEQPDDEHRSKRVHLDQDVEERVIKEPISRKRRKQPSPTSSIMDQVSSVLRGDWSWPSFSPKTEEIQQIGEKLTQELVAQAAIVEETIDQEEKPVGPKKRYDYFVQPTALDTQWHQYLLGLSAHFSYWNDKDVMYHIIKTLFE